MTNSIQLIILCGYSDLCRLLLSRAGFPKQVLCLRGYGSLFQQATKRKVTAQVDGIALYIVAGGERRFFAQEQLCEPYIELGAALWEQVGRNVGHGATLSVRVAVEDGRAPLFVVLPGDETVAGCRAFAQAMHQAIEPAFKSRIAVSGSRPNRSETVYDLITVSKHESDAILPLVEAHFVEKPYAVTAKGDLDEVSCFWNAAWDVLPKDAAANTNPSDGFSVYGCSTLVHQRREEPSQHRKIHNVGRVRRYRRQPLVQSEARND